MNKWIIKVLNNDVETEHTIEAIDYTAKRIMEIFNEVHPEWNITEVLPLEEKKQAV